MSATTAWSDSRPATVRPHGPARVSVRATDPLVCAGLRSELRDKPGIELLDDPAEAEVVVAVAGSALRDLLTTPTRRLVLVMDDPRQADLLTAIV